MVHIKSSKHNLFPTTSPKVQLGWICMQSKRNVAKLATPNNILIGWHRHFLNNLYASLFTALSSLTTATLWHCTSRNHVTTQPVTVDHRRPSPTLILSYNYGTVLAGRPHQSKNAMMIFRITVAVLVTVPTE